MMIARRTLYELIGSENPFTLTEAVGLIGKRGGVNRVEPGCDSKEFLDNLVEYGGLKFDGRRYTPTGQVA